MGKLKMNEKSLYLFIGASTAVLLFITIYMLFTFGAENRKDYAQKSSESLYADIGHTSFPKMAGVTEILASDAAVIQLASSKNVDAYDDTIIKLNMVQKTFGLDLCYILDASGIVVASSINAKDESLVIEGRDFSFRPYFTEAVKRFDVIYPALGLATNERGVYFSSPIVDSADKIIGVAVSKLGMQVFDEILFDSTVPAVVTTSDGIIFSTNQEGWLYKSIQPLSENVMEAITASRQFLDIPIEQLGISIQGDAATIHQQEYALSQRRIGDTDWMLYTFAASGSIPILTPAQWVFLVVSFAFFTLLIAAIAIVLHNISKSRVAEEMQQKLFLAVQQSSSVIVITDKDGIVEYVNPAFSQVTGYSLEECANRTLNFLKSDVHDQAYFEEMWNAISTGDDWRGTFCNKRKNGEVYWDETLISSVKDQKGRITHYIAIKEDITKRKEMDELLHRYATTDEMTGTLNRRSGMLIMQRQMQKANLENQSFVILFMDINGLKSVNDTLGHSYGDELIITAVGVLKDSLRESDAICRLGGDEFLIILAATRLAEAEAVLHRILDKAEAINRRDQHLFLLSLSFGAAEYQPGSGQTMDDLIRIADERMYKDKIAIKQRQGTSGVLRQQVIAD